MTQLPLRHPCDEALLHGFVDVLWAGVVKLRLPAGLEADFRQELYAYEEQQRMPYVTTVEQAGIQQGEALMLLALLQEKFGPDAADVYRERITAADPEQLLQWSKRILSAETPETIFH